MVRVFRPEIAATLRDIGKQLGERAEERVNEAFMEAKTNGLVPKWLSDWRRNERNSRLDRHGVDFGFFTDVGPIFIQVKSSRRNAEKFMLENERRRRAIRVVVIDVRKPNEELFKLVLTEISAQREIFLARRND
jgi:hypothetical protein